jgi:hypothetical protein
LVILPSNQHLPTFRHTKIISTDTAQFKVVTKQWIAVIKVVPKATMQIGCSQYGHVYPLQVVKSPKIYGKGCGAAKRSSNAIPFDSTKFIM